MSHDNGRGQSAVVVLAGLFEHLTVRIADHDKTIRPVAELRWQRHQRVVVVVVPHMQLPRLVDAGEQGCTIQRAVQREIDTVNPVTGRISLTVVVDLPAHAHLFTGRGGVRPTDGHDAQVRRRGGVDQRRREGGARVVVIKIGFVNLIIAVGTNQEKVATGAAERRLHCGAVGVGRTDRDRARVGHLRQQRIARVERGIAGQIDEVFPCRCVRRDFAGISHPPDQRHVATFLRGQWAGGDINLQIGKGRRQRDDACRQIRIVRACVGFE